MSKISEVRCWPIKNPKGKLRANGDFVYDGAFRLKFTVFEGTKGLFVSYPGQMSEKKDEKTGKNIFYPFIKCLSDDVRNELHETVMGAYNKATGNDGMNQGDSAGPSDQSKDNIPF